jgi:hypothetical protein
MRGILTMKKTSIVLAVLYVFITLTGCSKGISKAEMKKDKTKFIAAAKVCYKMVENHQNPFSNQTCVNLADVMHDQRVKQQAFIGGYGDCNNKFQNLSLAIAYAKRADIAMQEEKKTGW